MKKMLYAGALALPLAFSSCADDLTIDSVLGENSKGNEKVTLSENFVLTAGLPTESNDSRAEWITGSGMSNFYWIPVHKNTYEPINDLSLWASGDYVTDKIGMCYINGQDVITNYMFEHDGWVEADKGAYNDSKEPFWCIGDDKGYDRNYLRTGLHAAKGTTGNPLLSGYIYDSVDADKFNGTSAATWVWAGNSAKQGLVEHGAKFDTSSSAQNGNGSKNIVTINSNGVMTGKLDGKYSSAIYRLDNQAHQIQNLNMGNGVFRTSEKSIIKGDYLVYSPYSSTMLEKGGLKAVQPNKMTYYGVKDNQRLFDLKNYAFYAGYVPDVEGGVEAESFVLHPVSGRLGFEYYVSSSTPAGFASNKICKFILLSPKVEPTFTTQRDITVDNVKAGLGSGIFNGTDEEKEQFVMIDFKKWNGSAYQKDYLTFEYNHNPAVFHGHKCQRTWVPVLPTTIPAGMVILAVDENGRAVQYTTKNDIDVDAKNNVNVAAKEGLTDGGYNCIPMSTFDYYVVTNEEELKTVNGLNPGSVKKVLVIGKIELTDGYTFQNLELWGQYKDVKVGEIIIKHKNAGTQRKHRISPEVWFEKDTEVTYGETYMVNCKIYTDVTIEDKGCCFKYDGALYLHNCQFSHADASKYQNTLYNYGSLAFGNLEGNAGNDGSAQYRSTTNIYGKVYNQPWMPEDGATGVKNVEFMPYEVTAPQFLVEKETSVYLYGELYNNVLEQGVVAKNLYNKNERVQSYIGVSADPDVNNNTRKDGELTVVPKSGFGSKLVNYAIIDNYGTMANNTGDPTKILNEDLATYTLRVGGQLTGARLRRAGGMQAGSPEGMSDFIVEVDNSIDTRWQTAWDHNLANIIKIVEQTNANYSTNPLANTYSFNNIGNGNVRKDVMVIVEHPVAYFIYKTNSGSMGAKGAATIGRLLVRDGEIKQNLVGNLVINPKTTLVGTYCPLDLTVNKNEWLGLKQVKFDTNTKYANRTNPEHSQIAKQNAIQVDVDYANVKKFAGNITNNLTHRGQTDKNNATSVLTVFGDIDIYGDMYETDKAKLVSEEGDVNINKNGQTATVNAPSLFFDIETKFEVKKGNINVKDGKNLNGYDHAATIPTLGDYAGLIIMQKVNGEVTEGYIKVNASSYAEIDGDSKIRVPSQTVNNDGKFRWVSRTGTSSPGIVAVEKNYTGAPTNWINGTPTLWSELGWAK